MLQNLSSAAVVIGTLRVIPLQNLSSASVVNDALRVIPLLTDNS